MDATALQEAAHHDLVSGVPGMLKQVAIGSLMPNPFRRLQEYPIQREKVDKLRESYRSTTFWGNIVCREVKGKYEIAYGHHRLIALQEEYGERKRVEVIVRELSNNAMLQMMARENMEEWGTSAWVELETIRATIDAYGKGLIELPEVPKDTRKDNIRYVSHNGVTRPYTKGTVAEFLGWTRATSHGTVQPDFACDVAFRGVEIIDAGFIAEAQTRGLGRAQLHGLIEAQWQVYRSHMRVAEVRKRDAKQVAEQAKAAETPREKTKLEKKAAILADQAKQAEKEAATKTKQLARDVVPKIRSGETSIRDVRAEAAKRTATAPQPRVIDLEILTNKTSNLVYKVCNEDQIETNIKLLQQHKQDIPGEVLDSLLSEIKAAVSRLQAAAKALRV